MVLGFMLDKGQSPSFHLSNDHIQPQHVSGGSTNTRGGRETRDTIFRDLYADRKRQVDIQLKLDPKIERSDLETFSYHNILIKRTGTYELRQY